MGAGSVQKAQHTPVQAGMMCKLRLVDCRLSRNIVHDLTDIQLYIILIYSRSSLRART